MKAGNLVRTVANRIGIPVGSVGLIIESHFPIRSGSETPRTPPPEKIHTVQFVGEVGKRRGQRRFLERDLEIVS
jgi:hypothetical protein